MLQHVDRHGGLAAELARERPFGADAVGQDAAEHARAGRRARDLLDLGGAVDRVEAHAERIGARDVTLLLDRVAERDAVRRRAGRERHLDLRHGRRVEARAERGEQRQHLRRRIGLHGVEHARVGQRLGEGLVVVAHDVEVDDETRPVVGVAAQKVADARGHGRSPHKAKGRHAVRIAFRRRLRAARRQRVRRLRSPARWRRGRGAGRSTRRCCLGLERENPSARPARMDKPLGCRPLEGRRDHRSPLRRCFKPRPSRRARLSRFRFRLPVAVVRKQVLPQAAGGPLVRLPTDRHVATGTCEFGRSAT